MKDNFEKFCSLAKISSLLKFDAAVCFIWFHQQVVGVPEIDIKTINTYFNKAHLSEFPYSRLKESLTKSQNTTKGQKPGNYKLSRKCLESLNEIYLNQFQEEEITIKERAQLSQTPFFDTSDIDNAYKMAELYIIAHCFENSVRRFIDKILTLALGGNWWDTVSNRELQDKYSSRKNKEMKERWVSSRNAGSPLYYLDWTDLVKLIRKEESRFVLYINELKFVELRFEELERIRNVIAHNGVVENSDDIDRTILYFKDWCKQLSNVSIE